jgi:hypothetical protein
MDAKFQFTLLMVLTSAWFSGLFVALLRWDMAADVVGWLQSFWVPVFTAIVLLLTLTNLIKANDMTILIYSFRVVATKVTATPVVKVLVVRFENGL